MSLSKLMLGTGLCGLVLLLPGCYSYTPIQLRVEDGKSHAPVVGAMVSSGYMSVLDFFPPRDRDHVTDANGRATVRVALEHAIATVQVVSPDYEPFYTEVFPRGYGEIGGDQPITPYEMADAPATQAVLHSPLPQRQIVVQLKRKL